MSQKRFYKRAPAAVILRRGDVPLPIEHRLTAACKLLRHEAKLQKRTYAELQIPVENTIKICEIIFEYLVPFLVLTELIYSHVVTEKTMTAYMLKAYMLLNQPQLVHILLMQRKSHAPRSDTEVHIVSKLLDHIAFFYIYMFLSHSKPP